MNYTPKVGDLVEMLGDTRPVEDRYATPWTVTAATTHPTLSLPDGTTATAPVGNLTLWVDAETRARIVSNLSAAGYEFCTRDNFTGWWHPEGRGMHRRHPSDVASLASSFGHTLPPCVECGTFISLSFMSNHRLISGNVCFGCLHWLDLIGTRGAFVADGEHYTIGEPRRPGDQYAGHGGRRFDVEYPDGRRVTTYNLWYQGKVPAHFLGRFPVVARFVKGQG